MRNKLMLALAVFGAAGLTQTFAADGQQASPPPATTPQRAQTQAAVTAPVVLTGKIVVVDRKARTITVESDGKLHLIQVDPKVKMVNKGKLVALEDLVAGQFVAVLTKVASDGTLQVVALSVEQQPAAQEPAGPGIDGKGEAAGLQSDGNPSGNGNGYGAPFVNFANPANNLGPIISPDN